MIEPIRPTENREGVLAIRGRTAALLHWCDMDHREPRTPQSEAAHDGKQQSDSRSWGELNLPEDVAELPRVGDMYSDASEFALPREVEAEKAARLAEGGQAAPSPVAQAPCLRL